MKIDIDVILEFLLLLFLILGCIAGTFLILKLFFYISLHLLAGVSMEACNIAAVFGTIWVVIATVKSMIFED